MLRLVLTNGMPTDVDHAPFLLLSIRGEDAAADDEYQAMMRFAGLDVTVHESDDKRRPGHLSRQGPPVLREQQAQQAHKVRRVRPVRKARRVSLRSPTPASPHSAATSSPPTRA